MDRNYSRNEPTDPLRIEPAPQPEDHPQIQPSLTETNHYYIHYEYIHGGKIPQVIHS